MIKQLFVLAGIAAIASLPCLAKTVPSDDLKVVIIRHGEKPETGDNLSCQGENRALQIPEVIKQKYGIPNFSYVPTLSLGSSTSHARMFQTITPFAIKYNLTVNSSYGEKDTSKAAADVMKKTGTVLMVWEHSNIQALATSLGAKSAPPGPVVVISTASGSSLTQVVKLRLLLQIVKGLRRHRTAVFKANQG